jgi:hypothetical protein
MAQSAITVTPPNPTPPTNMSFLGTTPPLAPAQPAADDGTAGTLGLFAAKIASVDNANFPSVDHEGRGNELSVTAPGSRAECPTIAVSCGPVLPAQTVGGAPVSPNQLHASSLSPSTNPTLTTAGPSTASGTGNATVTATGVGFTKQSVIFVNGISYPTTFVSSTSLTASAPKKATAGTLPVNVVTGGAVTTASVNWTFT